jgi:NADH:ubiquinone oxidoreductase subunit 2 (subunit N)
MSQEGSPRRVEAVSKYFVAQAIARAFVLLGIVLQFSFKGSVEIFRDYKGISYIFLIIGLFIKLAVVPNPFWFVDTIRGLNLIQGFYVVIASKIIPIYLFIKLCRLQTKSFLGFVGIFSVALGRLLGLNQTKIRKIVAFSSIAHLG